MRRKIGKMNSKAKSKIIILLTLGILFALLPIITANLSFIAGYSNGSSEDSDVINLDEENIKISAVSEKIHINNNWTDAKAAGICTGNGTYSEPYVIEDLVIDGGGTGSCILIEYSDAYFKIENCTVYNSGQSYPNAGIRLSNVNNSLIITNNCSSNYNGIYLSYSNNNTISGNNATNNYSGIILASSNNNVLSENIANSNNDVGIYFYKCDYNNVSGNFANSNNEEGIYLYYECDNNIVSGNNANYNMDGISICGNYNNISKNIANNNNLGIRLEYSDYNYISGNTANNNSGNGIYLGDGDYNDISGNTVKNNSRGISLGSSSANNISVNTVKNNSVYGISIFCSGRNEISQNIIVGSNIGIYLYSYYYTCTETLMSSNEIFNNTFSGNNQDIVWYRYSDSGGWSGEGNPIVALGLILLVVAGVIISLLIEYGLKKRR